MTNLDVMIDMIDQGGFLVPLPSDEEVTAARSRVETYRDLIEQTIRDQTPSDKDRLALQREIAAAEEQLKRLTAGLEAKRKQAQRVVYTVRPYSYRERGQAREDALDRKALLETGEPRVIEDEYVASLLRRCVLKRDGDEIHAEDVDALIPAVARRLWRAVRMMSDPDAAEVCLS